MTGKQEKQRRGRMELKKSGGHDPEFPQTHRAGVSRRWGAALGSRHGTGGVEDKSMVGTAWFWTLLFL